MRGPERSHPTIYWSKQTRALGPRQRTTADLRDWKVITLNLPDSVKRACSFADLRHHPPAAHPPPSPLPPKLPPCLKDTERPIPSHVRLGPVPAPSLPEQPSMKLDCVVLNVTWITLAANRFTSTLHVQAPVKRQSFSRQTKENPSNPSPSA